MVVVSRRRRADIVIRSVGDDDSGDVDGGPSVGLATISSTAIDASLLPRRNHAGCMFLAFSSSSDVNHSGPLIWLDP